MSKINEKLILDVFREMLKFKPKLQRMLIQDDEEDMSDFRMIGDVIIKNFPWPIGVELRRLFSASMQQPDRMRLDQIFKTIERTMQLINAIMLSQLWKESQSQKLSIPGYFSDEFASRMSMLSMGNFTWLIRTTGKIFNENSIEWFMPEMDKCFRSDFYSALDFWVPERNEIGHYQINLNQEEIEKRCVDYLDKLSLILQKISFFSIYSMVSVKEIRVVQPKNRSAKFHHYIGLLNSSDSEFKERDLLETVFTESNSILLMKTLKSVGEYLNLSPLVIDTFSEIIDHKEKFDIKKDVFLFSKIKGEHMMYVGTEVTEKCDLRSLSNYEILLEQYKEMIETITGKSYVFK
jgi:hypothetical protein